MHELSVIIVPPATFRFFLQLNICHASSYGYLQESDHAFDRRDNNSPSYSEKRRDCIVARWTFLCRDVATASPELLFATVTTTHSALSYCSKWQVLNHGDESDQSEQACKQGSWTFAARPLAFQHFDDNPELSRRVWEWTRREICFKSQCEHRKTYNGLQ